MAGGATLVVLLIVFFSTPLIKFTDHLYSATDITQISFRTGAFLSIVGLVLGVSLVALCVNANRRARQIHA